MNKSIIIDNKYLKKLSHAIFVSRKKQNVVLASFVCCNSVPAFSASKLHFVVCKTIQIILCEKMCALGFPFEIKLS